MQRGPRFSSSSMLQAFGCLGLAMNVQDNLSSHSEIMLFGTFPIGQVFEGISSPCVYVSGCIQTELTRLFRAENVISADAIRDQCD